MAFVPGFNQFILLDFRSYMMITAVDSKPNKNPLTKDWSEFRCFVAFMTKWNGIKWFLYVAYADRLHKISEQEKQKGSVSKANKDYQTL